MKINVKHYHIEVEVSLPDDAAIDDIIDSIKGILSICGWADDTWRDQIIELSEHYQKQEQKQLINEIMNDDANDGLYKTNNMKLYTEEQVKEILGGFIGERNANDYLQRYYSPIELPSDKEIEETFTFYPQIIEGAKWMKEQILNQNK